MYSRSLVKRKINKKLKIAKYIQEEYVNDFEFKIPYRYKNGKPIYILDRNIINNYSTIILFENYNWLVCNSFINNELEDIANYYKKFSENLLLFHDNFHVHTSGRPIEAIKKYFKTNYIDFEFEIFDFIKMEEMVDSGFLPRDILHRTLISAENLHNTSHGTLISAYTHKGKQIDKAIFKSIRDALWYKDTVYTPYLENIKYIAPNKIITIGTLSVSSISNDCGEVLSLNGRIQINGKDINRAMHGDEVYVMNGKVVGIYKRKIRTIVGSLYKVYKLGDDVYLGYVKPIDRRLVDVCVITRYSSSFLNRKVVLRIIGWGHEHIYPFGVIFKLLENGEEIAGEVDAVMTHYDIAYGNEGWLETLDKRRVEIGELCNLHDINDFKNKNIKLSNCLGDDRTPEGLKFSPVEFSISRAIDEVNAGKRTDFRGLRVFSIDPPGCTDIDDALHCVMRDDYIEVGVHIADVSLYVKEGSALDCEGKYRSTTVYFPDRRIDMLPPFLSSDLCSLVKNKDRATMSCVWKLNKNYEIIETKICRSLIRSREAFTYKEAYELIKDGGTFCSQEINEREEIMGDLGVLLKISTKLRNDRVAQGALELSTSNVFVDENNEVMVKEATPMNYLIEEFMLLANISVAKFINRLNPEYSILRKHPLPSALDLEYIECSSSKAINDSLKGLDEDRATIVKRIITRSLQQAIYFVNGETTDFYHYGLATPVYTHFTSPIRRYPDIVVHRIIKLCLDGDTEGIDALADSVNIKSVSFMNYRHKNAQNASRMVNNLYLYATNKETLLDGLIVTAKDGGYIVYIKNFGIEEFVSSSDNYEVFDKVSLKLNKNLSEYLVTRKIDLKILKINS